MIEVERCATGDEDGQQHYVIVYKDWVVHGAVAAPERLPRNVRDDFLEDGRKLHPLGGYDAVEFVIIETDEMRWRV